MHDDDVKKDMPDWEDTPEDDFPTLLPGDAPPPEQPPRQSLSAEEMEVLRGHVPDDETGEDHAPVHGDDHPAGSAARVSGGEAALPDAPVSAYEEAGVVLDEEAIVKRHEAEDELWRSSSEAQEGSLGPFFIFAGALAVFIGLLIWLLFSYLSGLDLPEMNLPDFKDSPQEVGPGPESSPDPNGPVVDGPAMDGSSDWSMPERIDAPSRYLEGGADMDRPGGSRDEPPGMTPGPEDGPQETPDDTPPDVPEPEGQDGVEPVPDPGNDTAVEQVFDWEEVARLSRDMAAAPDDDMLAMEFQGQIMDALRMLSGLFKVGDPAAADHLNRLDAALVENEQPVQDMRLVSKSSSTPEYVMQPDGSNGLAVRGVVVNDGDTDLDLVLVRARLTDGQGQVLAVAYGLASKDIPTTGLKNMTGDDILSHLLNPASLRAIRPGESSPFLAYFPVIPEDADGFRVVPTLMFPPASPSAPAPQ